MEDERKTLAFRTAAKLRKIEKARAGTCGRTVLIIEEQAGLEASPRVEKQQGPALLEGLHSFGDHRGTTIARAGDRLTSVSLSLSDKAQ